MSEAETTKPVEEPKEAITKSKRERFPIRMFAFSVVITALIVLVQVFISEFVDFTRIAPDFANVLSYGLILIVWLAWVIWALFFCKQSFLFRFAFLCVLVGGPIAFFVGLRPVNDGDAGISRFEPIWRSNRVVPIEVDSSDSPVDLKTETPNDFAEFLGNRRDGIVRGQANLADDAVSSAQLVWKQEVGEGWSGFAARNGFAVTMEQRGEYECVTCYEIESGKLRWLYKHKTRHRDAMNLGRLGPRATPTIHEGRVYAVGAMGNVVCLDGSTGEFVWQKDLLDLLGIKTQSHKDRGYQYQYEVSPLAWGRSGSPLIVDDTVVVTGGGPRPPFPEDGQDPDSIETDFVTLLAFDKETGEERWRSGDEMIAYGSPSLATLCGRRQILLVAESKALGFDAKTGELLWEHDREGSSEAAANCSQVTVISDDTILLTKGYNMGGELVEVRNDSGGFETETLEANTRTLKTKLTSPVVHDGYAYSLSDGFLECTEVDSLARKWKKRGRFGHGQMLLCGDKLLVHSETGQLFLVKASPDKYQELGKIKTIKGVCWNTLCRFGDYLLVRSELEAACIRLVTEP